MSGPEDARPPFFHTVKARLLVAFGLVVGLCVAVGSIGWRGFTDTEEALNTLRGQSLPDISKAMELARLSSAVAAVAPFIGSIHVKNKLSLESAKIDRQLSEFRRLVDELEPLDRSAGPPTVGSLRDFAGRLEADLRELIDNTRQSLGARADMLEQRYAFEEHKQIEQRLMRQKDVRDDSFDRLGTFHQLIETLLTANSANGPMELDTLEAEYRHLAAMLAVDIGGPNADPIWADLKRFMETQSRVFELRRRAISTLDRTQFLLASIHAISKLLANHVSEVASLTTQLAQTRTAETNEALDRGRQRILLLTLVSLIVGGMAGFYILRNLAGNLQAVTAAMTRLASGDRNTTVPAMERVDELGDLARAFNIFKEQSFEREVLAESLIEKSRTLEATFANMTDGMSVFDTDGRLVAWNPQFISINELDPSGIRQGMHFREILDHLIRAGVTFSRGDLPVDNPDQFLKLRQTGTIAYEQIFQSERVVELRSRPMDGGFATIYADQTERRVFEERLRQAQRMEAVGQLTSGLAHDFNNLLAAVTGNLQLLEEALRDRADLLPRVLRAMDGAERGAELTQRLLAFSRQQALKPEATDVNELIRSLLDLLDFNFGDKISIKTELASDIGNTVIDRAQLENAILNLIFNARDAMPTGGTITIRTINLSASYELNSNRAVRIDVEDDGTGMTSEVLSRVFEPFFTTKERGRGSGLGLSMVYGFVNQSGGEVRLNSAPGKGTTVCLYLPGGTRADRVQKRRKSDGRHDEDVEAGTENILVVEDDRTVRETATDMLSRLGYQVLAAKDLPQAKDMLDRAHIDLVFTDCILPDGATGDDVSIYAQKVRADIGILYTSGYPHDKLRRDMLLARDATLITKPYRAQALARAIRAALDSRQSKPKRSTLLLRR